MQLGGTSTATTTIPSAAAAAAASEEAAAVSGGGGSVENMEEFGERGLGGNRWPRQETVALLKIRSDMDVAFHDAAVKAPLWEEVSRKLAGLGYHRSAKKCREKFENVYKYHKRTKEGRTGKLEGKNYRFFDQLQALEKHSLSVHSSQPPPPPPPRPENDIAFSAATSTTTTMAAPPPPTTTNLPSMTIPASFPPPNIPANTSATNTSANPKKDSSFQSNFPDFLSDSTSPSSMSSGLEIDTRRKKKRKYWKEFFERLTKQVVEKQEELQRRFMAAMEKREHERLVRKEAWRMQETARINREREILAQERSMAAAKDAAVMAFLQKFSENPNPGQPVNPSQRPPQEPPPQPQPQPPPAPAAPPPVKSVDVAKTGNGDRDFRPVSSSRWPKVEIEALIQIRTNLDAKYQENVPKGPLWEEISAGMRRLGYNRSSKRCKEKWENINKYFKKVKESNKKRPEDSKTCPYFDQLDAIYRHKHKSSFSDRNLASSSSSLGQTKPEDTVTLMVQPE